MKRRCIIWVASLLLAAAAAPQAQVIKPIEIGKRSGFENKPFKTDSMTSREFHTKEYRDKTRLPSKPYSSQPFSYSSKSYSTRMAPLNKTSIATPAVNAPAHVDNTRQVESKVFETTQMENRSLPGAIADKPTRDWQTFIRRDLPHRAGPHSNIPFSRWKASSTEKGADLQPPPGE